MKIFILHQLVKNWEKEEFSTKQVKFGTNYLLYYNDFILLRNLIKKILTVSRRRQYRLINVGSRI